MIASRLGHTSVRTVLNVYGHSRRSGAKQVAEVVDALRVETIGRFVEHQYWRVTEQCRCE